MAKNDRLRTPIDPGYADLLGRALYCFARMEWDAAYICQELQDGYLKLVPTKTAGNIARDLERLTSSLEIDACAPFATWVSKFRELVEVRNKLVHGNPGSVDGGQFLFNQGIPWTIERMNEAADDFTECQTHLNDLVYLLKNKKTS